MPNTPNTIRVVIVDDHPLLCEGLKSVLDQRAGMELVGRAADGVECLKMVAREQPDVLLLDVSLPDGNGIRLMPRIVEVSAKTRVLVASAHVSRPLVQLALDAGARGYISKESAGQHLTTAIERIAAGEVYLGPIATARLGDHRHSSSHPAYDLLTQREQQVFRLIASGYKTNEIARLLDISPKTANAHRGNLFQKLEISRDSQVWRIAVELGIIEALDPTDRQNAPGE